MAEDSGNEALSVPRDKVDLMARIQTSWKSLDDLVNTLSEEQMSKRDAGNWAIKDNLAHLASWEQFMVLRYLQKKPGYQAMQIDENTLKQLSEDGINEILFRRHAGKSVAEVLKFYREVHANVVSTLERMPFEDLMVPQNEKDPKARPVILWVIGNTYDHYAEHEANIKKLIQAG